MIDMSDAFRDSFKTYPLCLEDGDSLVGNPPHIWCLTVSVDFDADSLVQLEDC